MTPHRPANLARWQSYADAIPLDVWLTVPELAALWWPDVYSGQRAAQIHARRRAETAAHHRIADLTSAGLVEVERRPHPTRAQDVIHARRPVWKERGRWMVGEER